jgi:hypothetical protein
MTSSIRRKPALVCAAALLLLAPAAQADLSPCKLLTASDVQGALGGQWQVWQDLSSDEVCAFQSSPTSVISLTLASDPMGAATMLELRRAGAGDKARSVSGLGEAAYAIAMPSANVVMFGKGNTVAQLEVSFAASQDPAIAEKLAQAAYARMP